MKRAVNFRPRDPLRADLDDFLLSHENITQTDAIHQLYEGAKEAARKAKADLETYKSVNVNEILGWCDYLCCHVPKNQCLACVKKLKPRECQKVSSAIRNGFFMRGEKVLQE